MYNSGKCIHGVELIFDGMDCVERCEICRRQAIGAINPILLDKFMTKEEQEKLLSK